MDYLLTKNFTAGAAVAKRRIVKFGDTDTAVIPATGPGDALIGIAAELDVAADARIDVHLAGIAEVEAGGAITRGARVTAGADGKAAEAEAATVFQVATAGAAANTDIVVAGIKPGDELVSVIELADGYADRTANAAIHAADTIRITDATDGDRLLVTWRRPMRTVGVALQASRAAGDLIRMLIQPGLA